MNYEAARIEPTLDELFKDPIIQLLMQRDGVEPADLDPILDKLSEPSAMF